jgi:calcineurin-like phosphoesterase family protein
MKQVLDLEKLLIEQLQMSDHVMNRPQVKDIAPWKSFKSIVKNERIDISAVPPEKIWFWSDQHFGHNNIIKYCDRPFRDIQDMQEQLIANYNSVVKPGDVVFWVGDVTFTEPSLMNEIMSELPGYNILVLGNHDIHHGGVKNLDFDEIHKVFSLHNFVVSHHPWHDVPKGYFHIHGHTHNHKTSHPRHINVCVENTNYTPRNFTSITEKISNITGEI